MIEKAAKALYDAVVLDRRANSMRSGDYPDWDGTSEEIRKLYLHLAEVTLNAYK